MAYIKHQMPNARSDANVFWYAAGHGAPLPQLSGATRADVVVIGGGMAGLSCAQRLLEAGKSVVLVEKYFCGAGASGKTSGFVTPDSEIVLSDVLKTHGPERAKRIWQFVLSGVDHIRNTIVSHRIDCDYRVQDCFFVAKGRAGQQAVATEHQARQSLGYASRIYLDAAAAQAAIGSPAYAGGVRYPDTFGVNSYLYCRGLRDILLRSGARIFEQSPAVRITAAGVETPAGIVQAQHVVVCADRFIPEFGFAPAEIYHVQTFLAISKPLADRDMRRVFPDGELMVWDTDLIYHYFRPTGDSRILLGGGDLWYTYARSPATRTARFARRFRKYASRVFPDIPIELEYVWPGMLGVSKDLLPVMGYDPVAPNVWYVGAATGLPWAAALGIYAAERIISGRDEFDEDFSQRRRFLIGRRMQQMLTTPVTYALSHGAVAYL